MEFMAGQRIDSQGTIESVAVLASECLFPLAGARVSIFWGDSVCQVRNLTYGGHGLIAF